jgi:hypothetical protein
MTKRGLVALASALEAATGVALIAQPASFIQALLRVDISGGGVVIGRVAGLALLALGLACWPVGQGPTLQAIRALFTYNLLAALYLGYLAIGGDFASKLLWPTVALHALIALLLARPASARLSPE